MKRKRTNKRADKKKFSKTAAWTQPKNVQKVRRRGGIRL